MADDKPGGEHPKVTAVREAAELLADAIVAARRAGFSVTLPSRAEDLSAITVSQTGRIVADDVDEVTALLGTPVATVALVKTVTPVEIAEPVETAEPIEADAE